MTSNAYIATDGTTVMKVGKANDVKRRERQIAIPVTFTVTCLDEATAFQVEDRLRQFVIEQGGIQHQETIDWFKFDERIYAMLCEFANSLEATPIEIDMDIEIAYLQARYYQLLLDEAKLQLAERDAEIARLQEQVVQVEQKLIATAREAERWKVRYEILKERMEVRKDST